jgi:hypothetical protein
MTATFTIDRYENAAAVNVLAAGGQADLALPALDPDLREAWDTAGLWSDWDVYDPRGTAVTTLFTLCDLLRPYESPEWGNTGGRYGYSAGAGGLTSWDWHTLDSGCFPDEGDSRENYSDPWIVQELATYLGEDDEHLVHVVHLADLLSQIVARCDERVPAL